MEEGGGVKMTNQETKHRMSRNDRSLEGLDIGKVISFYEALTKQQLLDQLKVSFPITGGNTAATHQQPKCAQSEKSMGVQCPWIHGR